MAGEKLGEVADPEDVQAIADAIGRLYRQRREGKALPQTNGSAFEKFDVRHLTGLLAGHLSVLTGRRPQDPGNGNNP